MASSSGSSSKGIPWKGILIIIVLVMAGYASPTHNPFGVFQSVATFFQTFQAQQAQQSGQ